MQPWLQHPPFNKLSWEQFEALPAALVEANVLTLDCASSFFLLRCVTDTQKNQRVSVFRLLLGGGRSTRIQSPLSYHDHAPVKDIKPIIRKCDHEWHE